MKESRMNAVELSQYLAILLTPRGGFHRKGMKMPWAFSREETYK